jgi:hypothetical protein
MMQAAREVVAENEGDDASHITACFDGTRQKRGHTSLNGLMSTISVNRRKVLDIETVGKSCFFVTPIQIPNMSVKNHEGETSGMECVSVPSTFNCYFHIQSIGIC